MSGAIEFGSPNTLTSTAAIDIKDDILLTLGNDADGVLILKSGTLSADTALTGVLEATVEGQALPVNSLIIANATSNSDIAMYVNKGTDSQMFFWADGSTGNTAIMAASGASVDTYIAGTKEIDYATGAFAFQQATTLSTSTGALTINAFTLGGAVTCADNDFTGIGDMTFTDESVLQTGTAATDFIDIRARKTDATAAYQTVARVQSAATDTYIGLGGSQEFKFYNSGIAYFGGLLFMGDSNITAEAVMGITTGIQIDQGASDDAVLVFKSSDVAHGGTGLADTDTFAYFKKVASTSGGLLIRTYKDADDGNNSAFLMESYLAENVDTTKSTAGRAIIEFKGAQITGTAQANVVADGNVFAVRGRVGGSDTTLALVDEDGDLWLNGGITASTLSAITLAGAVAGGDQAFTGVGDMTFTDGSELVAIDGAGTTLLIGAGGTGGLTFITLTSQSGGTDTMSLGAFTLGGTVTGAAQILSNLGMTYIGDTANTNMTLGLTINQGAANNEALAIKSSGVNHGRTSYGETDTYFSYIKRHADYGGIKMYILGENNASQTINASIISAGGQADTTISSAGRSLFEILIEQHNGSNALADVTSGGNAFGVRMRTGGNYETGLLLSDAGNLWLNGGITSGGTVEMAANNLADVGQIEISETDGIPIGTIKTVKVTKAHDSDLFDAAGVTDNVTIWQQPAGTVLMGAKMRLETQFNATSMSDLDVTVGLAGDEDGLILTTTNLTSDSVDTEYKTRGAYWDTSAEGSFWYSHSATDWKAYATATGANLNTTDAGTMDFYFMYLEL